MRTTHALSTPESTNRQRTGDGIAAVLDKRGYTPSSGTSDKKTSGCGGQALCTRPSSLTTSGGNGYAPAGACPVMMMMIMMMMTKKKKPVHTL